VNTQTVYISLPSYYLVIMATRSFCFDYNRADCAAGTYSASAAAYCSLCAAGTYAAAALSTTCAQCLVGTYPESYVAM
jgi:hypothetical protein